MARVIVEFADVPVVQVPGIAYDARAYLDLNDPKAVAQRENLAAFHQQWRDALPYVCPNAVVDWTYSLIFNGAAVRLPDAQVPALEAMPGVVAVWPQGTYEACLDASIPAMGADDAWRDSAIGGQNKAGEGVKVAIVDYGVFTAHEFLAPGNMRYPRGFPKGERDHCTPKVIACRSFFRADDPVKAGKEYADVRDSSNHGTHIAGIVGGMPREVDSGGKHQISGVAPGCYLMAYKILYTSEKNEASVYDGEALAALEAVVDDGADICNNSWGHPVVFHPEREPINVAIGNMVKSGIVVVQAGGNERQRQGECSIFSPGCHPAVLTVGSYNAANDEIENASSPGPSLDWRLKPDLAGPGVNVLSSSHGGLGNTANQYKRMNGTSMAAPHISGAAALLKQAHPDWSPAKIKSALMLTAVGDAVKEPGGTEAARITSQGAGRVAVDKALHAQVWTDTPSISLGLMQRGKNASVSVQLHSMIDKEVGYDLAVNPRLNDEGLTINVPPSLKIPGGGHGQASFSVGIGKSVPFGDYEGELTFTPSTINATPIHMPYWFRVVPDRAEHVPILLIDLDLSQPRAANDQRKVWEDALLDSKNDCDVWDAREKGKLPEFEDMMPYRAVIIFSGDNNTAQFWNVEAADEFLQYVYAGNSLALCGNNLPALFEPRHIGKTMQIRLDGSQDLYEGRIKRGSIRGQDGGPWEGLTFDIAPNRDNADFLTKLRELRAEYIFIKDLARPSLKANGASDRAASDGYVAFHRAAPKPAPGKIADFPFRIVCCTFGVESISEKTRENTRAEFVGALASWLLDQPAVSVGPSAGGGVDLQVVADGDGYRATVRATSGTIKTVEIDWGDGEKSTGTSPDASHTYSKPGTYNVRVGFPSGYLDRPSAPRSRWPMAARQPAARLRWRSARVMPRPTPAATARTRAARSATTSSWSTPNWCCPTATRRFWLATWRKRSATCRRCTATS